MSQASSVPTAPGEDLSVGRQGQVVLAVWMGSQLHHLPGAQRVHQHWGLGTHFNLVII